MSAELRAALDTIAATPGVLRALLEAVPLALAEAPLDGGWSPKDVIAHLSISEDFGSIGRLRRVVAEDTPLLPSYDETRELERSGLRGAALEELLARFERQRDEDVAWLRALPSGAYQRAGRHEEVGVVTGAELIFQCAYHDHLHLEQLARMLRAPFEPLRGPLRVF